MVDATAKTVTVIVGSTAAAKPLLVNLVGKAIKANPDGVAATATGGCSMKDSAAVSVGTA